MEPVESAQSGEKRLSLRAVVGLIALLTSAIGAAAGQYLLGEKIVAELIRSPRLFAFDPFLSAVLPGISVLITSAVLFTLVVRLDRRVADGVSEAPRRHGGTEGGLETRRWRRNVWLAVFGFGACFLGLGLTIYLAKTLLAGAYKTELLLVFVAGLVALGLAFLCNDLRLALVLGSTLRRRWKLGLLAELAFLVGLAALFVYLNGRDLAGYFYAAIGDEYSFFYVAKAIALGGPFNLFSQKGVYDYHPVADSAYQALVMSFFGINQFGWKLSGVLIVALSLFPTYFLARHLFGIWAGTAAAAIAASSHYLFAYSHTGYNNLHALLPTLLAAWAGAIGLTRRSSFLVFVAGAAAGLGFYTYFTARLAIMALVLAVLTSRFKLSTIRLLLSAAVGFAVAALPIFLVSKMDVINATVANSAAKGNLGGMALAEEVLRRTAQSALVFNYNTANGRFLIGSLLDPISAALAAVGVVYAILRLRDSRFLYLLVWLLVGLVIAGGFNHGTNIAETRLMLLVPFIAVLAGAAFDGFVRAFARFMRSETLQRVAPPAVLVLLFPAVLFANLERFWIDVPAKLPLRGENLALRVALSTEVDHSSLASVVVVAPAPDALARLVFDAHDLGRRSPILIGGGEKGFAARYSDSPAIALIETSPADVKSILSQLQATAPEAYYTEEWDSMRRGVISVLRNPKPRPSLAFLEPGTPLGLRAVMRLGGHGKVTGRFSGPRDVAVDGERSLYVADTGNGRIQKFDAGGKQTMTFGGRPGSDGYLKAPVSVAVSTSGEIAVLDAAGPVIKRFAPDGRYLGKFGSDRRLTRPRGIAYDPEGNLYVADGLLLKLAPDGHTIASIEIGGEAGHLFKQPDDIAFDSSGYLYVVDGPTGTVVKLGLRGGLLSTWNTPARGGSTPLRLAMGPSGSAVILMPDERRVLRVSPTGQVTGDLSGKAIVGERLVIPAGLDLDGLGYVYIADAGMHQLTRFAFFGE